MFLTLCCTEFTTMCNLDRSTTSDTMDVQDATDRLYKNTVILAPMVRAVSFKVV